MTERDSRGYGGAKSEQDLPLVAAFEATPSPQSHRDARGRFVAGHPRLPRRRPGAQVANLNSAKNPWVTFWKRRALKPEHRWALALVRDYVPSLVADKGGQENVSFAELKVMETAAVARVCWALSMAGGDLEAVARFLGQERAALDSIGLGRRARETPSVLDAYRKPAAARVAPAAESEGER